MAASANGASGAVQTISATAEQSSASIEEISASAEEMTAQVEEVTAQAEEMAATAEQLKALVSRFRLEDDAPVTKVGHPRPRRRTVDADRPSALRSAV
jgi:hypothetical protein